MAKTVRDDKDCQGWQRPSGMAKNAWMAKNAGMTKTVRGDKDCQGWQSPSGIAKNAEMAKTVRDDKEYQARQRVSGMAKTVWDVRECQGCQRMSGMAKSVKERQRAKTNSVFILYLRCQKAEIKSYIKAYPLFKLKKLHAPE